MYKKQLFEEYKKECVIRGHNPISEPRMYGLFKQHFGSVKIVTKVGFAVCDMCIALQNAKKRFRLNHTMRGTLFANAYYPN
jgi:hypothetical protein